MHRKASIVVACALLAASARAASAQSVQPWIDRGYLNVNLGFEKGSGTLEDSATFSLYEETGTKNVLANVDSGLIFDFSVGARVYKNASFGIGFHRGSSSDDATVTAAVPHPLIFTQPRNVSVTVSDLDRTERAIHLQFGYMLPVNDKVDVLVFGGPSFFRLSQDVVSDVTFAEAGSPFTTVNATPVIAERDRSVTGVNIGADVTYKMRDTSGAAVGVGAFIRYAGANAEITVMQSEVETDLGGFQIGFGLRVRF